MGVPRETLYAPTHDKKRLVFFGDVRIAQFVHLEQPPPIASIDTGVHDLQVLCSVGAWRGHV